MKTILDHLKIIWIWTKLTCHNTWGILNVLFIVWIRPMKGGQVDEDHPLVTGINPKTNDYIWHDNLIFKTERDADKDYPDSDREIMNKVGNHMRSMIQKSASSNEFPLGQPNRMPPAINYIHGGVLYNGGFLLFNNFKEAIQYFSNKDFQKEFLRFVKEEKREPVTIFRDSKYDREEFLDFACFMRSVFPYFSNSNGSKKRIGWGNPTPYPAVNTITGYWKADTYKFYSKEKVKTVARPPVAAGVYFQQAEYAPGRQTVRPIEHWLAKFTNDRVIARGKKGNVFFVDNRKLLDGYKFDPARKLPNLGERLLEKAMPRIFRT